MTGEQSYNFFNKCFMENTKKVCKNTCLVIKKKSRSFFLKPVTSFVKIKKIEKETMTYLLITFYNGYFKKELNKMIVNI